MEALVLETTDGKIGFIDVSGDGSLELLWGLLPIASRLSFERRYMAPDIREKCRQRERAR